MAYVRAEDYDFGNLISEIVLADIFEANPTETWENNERVLVNINSSGNFTDTNIQERIVCGFNVDIGTVAYGARPYYRINSLDIESMLL